MQEWLLTESIKSEDIDFINNCGVDYTIDDPALLGPTDSGWCDAATGYRIPTATMRVTFNVMSSRDVHILKLKFGDALIPTTIITESLPD